MAKLIPEVLCRWSPSTDLENAKQLMRKLRVRRRVKAISRQPRLIWACCALICAVSSETWSKQNSSYERSSVNREAFDTAVRLANVVLSASGTMRLQLTETAPVNTNLVQVLLVKFPREDRGKVAMVPAFDRRVLVDGREVNTVLDRLLEPSVKEKRLKESRLLALFLLHECGHITHLDYLRDPPPVKRSEYHLDVAYTNLVTLKPTSLNMDPSDFKRMEEAADAFAGESIRKALTMSNNMEIWGAAFDLEVAAGEVSSYLQADRQQKHFGAVTLGDPSVLADPDLGHPNLELRFLRINYYITLLPEAKSAVESFISARSNVQFLPRVLYVNTNQLHRLQTNGAK